MSKESINPVALSYIFEETLFHFSDELIISSKNEDFIGSNNSNISIICGKTLSKSDLGLLEKILKALSLSFDDIALIENKESLDLPEFIEKLSPKKIVLFGINTFEIGLKDVSLNVYLKVFPFFKQKNSNYIL